MIRSILISTVDIASIATAAAPAAAESISQRVGYADLNLASPAGIAALRQRVATAVKQICGKAEVRDIHSDNRVEDCRRKARAGVEPQLALALSGGIQLAEAQTPRQRGR